MMYVTLYRYLLHYKILPVPGIGTFLLERNPAIGDFPERRIVAPSWSFSLEPEVRNTPRNFFSWLGGELHSSDREAANAFQQFSSELANSLAQGDTIQWKGLGQLVNRNKSIGFIPEQLVQEDPVSAVKVIRENAAHTVRVGEEEKSSEEMTVLLSREPVRKNWSWLPAAILILLSVLFIGWYLSEHGVTTAGISNQSTIRSQTADTTYREIH